MPDGHRDWPQGPRGRDALGVPGEATEPPGVRSLALGTEEPVEMLAAAGVLHLSLVSAIVPVGSVFGGPDPADVHNLRACHT